MSDMTPSAVPEPGERFWRVFDRADHWLLQGERVGFGLAGAAILVTFLVMIGGVFSRPWTGYLFSVGVEGGKMGLWIMGYMPAAYIWRHYGHVRFDLVLRGVSFRAAQRIEVANCILGFILACLMTWSAWQSYWDVYIAKTRTLTLHFEYWPVFWVSVAGAGLLAIEVLFAGVRHWRESRHPTGKNPAPWDMPTEAL